MATRQTVDKTLAMLVANYPQKPADAQEAVILTTTWMQVLDDVPDALLEAVARDYLKSGATWRPAPGQLRERALKISDADAAERAEVAWQRIGECDFGRDMRWLAGDSLALTVLNRLGGFDTLGNTEIEHIHFFKERFVKMYADLAERAQGKLLIGTGNNPRVDELITATAKRLKARTLATREDDNGHHH